MSFANNAVRKFQNAGYDVEVQLVPEPTDNFSKVKSSNDVFSSYVDVFRDSVFGKKLRRGETLPKEIGDILNYPDKVTFKAGMPVFPKQYHSGGLFTIYENGNFSVHGYTNIESIKLLIDAGYGLPEDIEKSLQEYQKEQRKSEKEMERRGAKEREKAATPLSKTQN